MKSSKQCPKCDSLRIGFLPEQPDESLTEARRRLGEHVTTFRNQRRVRPVGVLEAYFCTECGYHETYITSPGSIVFDEIENFRWVNPPPRKEGPFR